MSTPVPIAETLLAAGWQPLDGGTNWQRPGPHPDVHSYPVADLIQRTDEPHHAPPPPVTGFRPPRPGFGRRVGSRAPALTVKVARPATTRPAPGQAGPRKAELIRRVAHLRDHEKLTFVAIAAQIGGVPARAHYLYSQAGKLAATR